MILFDSKGSAFAQSRNGVILAGCALICDKSFELVRASSEVINTSKRQMAIASDSESDFI